MVHRFCFYRNKQKMNSTTIVDAIVLFFLIRNKSADRVHTIRNNLVLVKIINSNFKHPTARYGYI